MEKVSFNYDFKSHSFNSPGYLICDLPECVINEIKKIMLDLDNGIIEKDDARKLLAGHLEKEYNIPVTPNLKYLVESMSNEYDKIFLKGKPIQSKFIENDDKNYEYHLKSLWINYSKKHDFNPIHSHSGAYSFVIWISIPYDLNEELSKYNSNINSTSLFSFHYITSLGEIGTESLLIDKSYEWKLAFFPAKLQHSVNPFFTSDDYRISISGNIFYSPISYNNEIELM